METKDFEKVLPKVLKRIGLKDCGCAVSQLISNSPIVMEVPENFDFKGVLENSFKQYGIELIYVGCKTDTADTIFAKMDSVCWFANISSEQIEQVKQESEDDQHVSSVLLINHYSDLKDEKAKRYIESALKANKENQLCGLKNIPLVLTFSKKEGMDFFYRNDFNIYDERYWK